MAAVPLTTFAVVQLRRQASSDYDWNESICKVFVSTGRVTTRSVWVTESPLVPP